VRAQIDSRIGHVIDDDTTINSPANNQVSHSCPAIQTVRSRSGLLRIIFNCSDIEEVNMPIQ
jgi:hypothetical protein